MSHAVEVSSTPTELIDNVKECNRIVAGAKSLARKPLFDRYGLNERLVEGFCEAATVCPGFTSTLGLTVDRAKAGRYDNDVDGAISSKEINIFRAFLRTAYKNPQFCA